jgi:hypothetical protein
MKGHEKMAALCLTFHWGADQTKYYFLLKK